MDANEDANHSQLQGAFVGKILILPGGDAIRSANIRGISLLHDYFAYGVVGVRIFAYPQDISFGVGTLEEATTMRDSLIEQWVELEARDA